MFFEINNLTEEEKIMLTIAYMEGALDDDYFEPTDEEDCGLNDEELPF